MSKSDAQFAAELLVIGLSAYAGAAQAQHDSRVSSASRRIESQRRLRSLEVLGREFGLLLSNLKRGWFLGEDVVKEVIVDKNRGVTANQLHQMLDVLQNDWQRTSLCEMLEDRVTNPGSLDLEAHFQNRFTARCAAENFLS